MQNKLIVLVTDYAERKKLGDLKNVQINGDNPWDISISFSLPNAHRIEIRNIRCNDLSNLLSFCNGLSNQSKDLFSPFPYEEPDKLQVSLKRSIQQTLEKEEVSYLVFLDGKPSGYFVLWNVNYTSQKNQDLWLPVLGVAIVDKNQNKGLGGLAVRILKTVGEDLNLDGIELTTSKNNRIGLQLYSKNGFERIGVLRIPLGVDFTANESETFTPIRYRDEHHMVYILNETKRSEIMDYLQRKRIKLKNLGN